MAYGYTLQVNGKQERCSRAEWTREDVQNALAARLLERDTPPAPAVRSALCLRLLGRPVSGYGLYVAYAPAVVTATACENVRHRLPRLETGQSPAPIGALAC